MTDSLGGQQAPNAPENRIFADMLADQHPDACLSCGERNDGGYTVEDGPGPFCSQCWELLRANFQLGQQAAPAPPDNALKIACAELAGYYDGFEGLPENPTFKSSDENWAYMLWFGKARKVRSDLVDQINTLARLLETERAKSLPAPPGRDTP